MILSHPSRRAERLLVPAAFATSLGNNVQLIVGALLVIREQQTMVAVGWLFIAVAGPQALLSPLFGRLADRFDRRSLWVGCDVVSAALALGLPLWLAFGGAAGPGIYGANLALAVVGALFLPASSALIKERIPADRLRRFNARYEMGTQAGMLLSATVGGLCVQAFGAVPLLAFNAGTFLVSALCVAAVGRRQDQVPTATVAPDGLPTATVAPDGLPTVTSTPSPGPTTAVAPDRTPPGRRPAGRCGCATSSCSTPRGAWSSRSSTPCSPPR
ncbi:MFS transporter [Streptomyces venezuelae]|uniref:MFS transporter n=1 Tax=Streptomyces venezuelae TaxID=54571 RepID=UPI00278C0117|nr:MFS transporter [Streptomyces venezuelae]